MKKIKSMTYTAAIMTAGALALTGCGSPENGHDASQPQSASEAPSSGEHEHDSDGGQPPEGIQNASDPTYTAGDEVVLAADHMPGMDGAEARISGAFDTTTYAVSYTPTDGSEPVANHKWVVHEELENPGKDPLKAGTEVVLNADHMPGMMGVTATIDISTDETVYMVDLETDGMKMTNHKWVVESEIQPAK